MEIKQAISINANIGIVFSYLKDFKNRTSFINYMDEVRLVGNKTEGLGVRYVEIATILGRNFETIYEVVEFVENEMISVKSIGAVFPITSTLKLKQKGEETVVGLAIKVKLPFLMKVGETLISGFIDSEAIRILKALKSEVEKFNLAIQ
ncbi:MAG: SRPBCC family protein [Bacteroidota bacterium]